MIHPQPNSAFAFLDPSMARKQSGVSTSSKCRHNGSPSYHDTLTSEMSVERPGTTVAKLEIGHRRCIQESNAFLCIGQRRRWYTPRYDTCIQTVSSCSETRMRDRRVGHVTAFECMKFVRVRCFFVFFARHRTFAVISHSFGVSILDFVASKPKCDSRGREHPDSIYSTP